MAYASSQNLYFGLLISSRLSMMDNRPFLSVKSVSFNLYSYESSYSPVYTTSLSRFSVSTFPSSFQSSTSIDSPVSLRDTNRVPEIIRLFRSPQTIGPKIQSL